MRFYAITGTYHGSIIFAESEGNARRAFHSKYNGESITHVRKMTAIEEIKIYETI